MGLAAYSSTNIVDKIDADHPFFVAFDGRVGGIQERCIYLRNDDLDSWFSDIVVSIVNAQYTWKLLEKDRVPIPEDWEGVLPSNTITLSSNIGSSTIGDISTFLPIWVRIEVPAGLPIQAVDGVIIRVSSTRHLI